MAQFSDKPKVRSIQDISPNTQVLPLILILWQEETLRGLIFYGALEQCPGFQRALFSRILLTPQEKVSLEKVILLLLLLLLLIIMLTN